MPVSNQCLCWILSNPVDCTWYQLAGLVDFSLAIPIAENKKRKIDGPANANLKFQLFVPVNISAEHHRLFILKHEWKDEYSFYFDGYT
jgi:hypothetical protein